MTPDAFRIRLAAVAEAVEARLGTVLSDAPEPGERARPERLMAAMRHAVLAGGKRMRPFLLVEAAALFDGAPIADPLVAAAAVECLHGYSLVHDDLPAMDDDDLRRGRPTVHRAFDEATAILVGDGLQTLAFDLLSRADAHPDPAVRLALVLDLARASGIGGMVGGQMLDLAAEGRFGDDGPLALSEADIRGLQAMKTGALIRAACTMGARLGGAEEADVARLARYGDIVGLAFQLADDLLDVTADAATMGKATAKDAGRGKGTLVQRMGVEAARAELAALVQEACGIVEGYGPRGRVLAAAARFIATRNN
ncbi:MAG TPA: farnesyl diphosphate synthase [Methylomirabilota bacterium]|nr:farnesyl diphosphate synthase [Methylomirabilota bacterium]